jgi:hypothetical protein
MPATIARVPTSRASRYLAQLRSHGSLMSRLPGHRTSGHRQGHGNRQGHGDGVSGMPPAATASSSGAEGIIDFGWGRCTLHASADALTLHAEADDPLHLEQIQGGITARLERMGRRDQLTVTWTPAVSSGTPPARI